MTQVVRSRGGALLGALAISTVATGVMFIAVPLELRSLHASPQATGITLAMFGLGAFLFEWVWGLVADRFGYARPLVVSMILFSAGMVFLARSTTVPQIALSYLVTTAMLVSVGPIGRSFLGTTLPPHLRATGLAVLSAEWLIGDAIGSGAGGLLIERMPISSVLSAAAVLPLITAALLVLVFRGYRQRFGHEVEPGAAQGARGRDWVPVMVVTAAIMVLFQVGAFGETAFLPLLVTVHLNLSAADAGTALFAAGLVGGLLLVPGGMASDRWGRRPAIIAGCLISAVGFLLYAVAGVFAAVIVAAAVRALGSSLIWPAATAWISDAAPRRRHALMMGLFGEFENLGGALGPAVGGIAWSMAGIPATFVVYAVAVGLAAAVAGLTGRLTPAAVRN
ncbi:MAG TPA: MFS transporter [Candidatus Dormibacteraeota bacterium]|nr:MFS transporter [Candidatus Dormibacteraeota bacterium]